MRIFVKLATLACGAGLACFSFGCASHGPHEDNAQKLSTNDVPAPVMTSIKNRFPGAQVRNVEKENEHGAVVYDFELTQSGRKYESDVREDGTIMEVEKQVDQADVPPAVMQAVQQKVPGATVKEIMEVNKVEDGKETPQKYEITVTMKDGKSKEVTTGLNGQSAKEEEEDEGGK